jgi:PleD family two-component response regulator
MIKRLLNWLGRKQVDPLDNDHDGIDNIYQRSFFLKLIEMERCRSNRNNLPFSLLLFNVNQNQTTNWTTDELVKHISKRVRRIDQLGWYDRHHIGILLPNTSAAGAQTIAKDICGKQDTPFIFHTLTYPDIDQMN